MSDRITPNHREIIAAQDDITGTSFYVQGTQSNGAINVNVTGGGTSGTQYAEGATTSPGTGTLAIGRYTTVAPTLTNGELYGLQLDSSGNLKVSGSLSVGGTTDNSAFTAGSSTGTPAMGFYHSTIDTVTDGRSAAVAITSKRGQHSNLRDSSGNELLGQKTMVNSIPVTISSDQTATSDITSSGNITSNQNVALTISGQSTVGVQVTGSFTGTLQFQGTTDGSTWSPTTVIQLSNGTISSSTTGPINGQANVAGLSGFRVLGNTVSAGTAVVTLRGSVGTSTVMLDNPLPTGANTIGGVTQSGTWNINNISGTVSLPTGAATAAKQPALGTAGTASTDVITVQGITSMTPIQVSQATAANLNATVVGTGTFAVQAAQSGTWTVQPGNTANTTPWLVKSTASTSAVTSVASSATNVTLLASNANRRAATFYNDSTQVLYLKLGATASNISYTIQIAAGGYYELPQPGYTGQIDGIWASANGNARITEITT